MGSSSLAAIVEALTKLFNPKLEKELAIARLEQDFESLNAVLRLGLKPESIEYRDGRLHFKMTFSEASDIQSADVISLESLKKLSPDSILPGGDGGKLKLEPPRKKYE